MGPSVGMVWLATSHLSAEGLLLIWYKSARWSSRNYDYFIRYCETGIHLAMCRLMLKRRTDFTVYPFHKWLPGLLMV